MISLSKEELVDLYLLLRQNEEKLGKPLNSLLFRVEREMYNNCSIEEIENLSEIS